MSRPYELRSETQVVTVSMTIRRHEAARLYWALDDVCEVASERSAHPRRRPLYDLFDQLYELGAADWSQEADA